MRPRDPLLLSLLLATACTSGTALPLPAVPDARSMLLVYADAGRTREGIYAIDLDGSGVPPIALRTSDRLFLLAYPSTLAELGLAPGPIQIVDDEPDRPLPSGYTVLEATGEERQSVEIEEEVFREFMGDVRLRGLASPECEDSGGCFRLVAGEEHCALPCTLPGVTPPADPDPPAAPAFEPCPAGWTLELGACTPPATADCAAGEAQLLGDPGCTLVAGACTGRFPSGLSGTIAYVDPAVAGPGSGTEADPFRLVSSALASGADSIALASGAHLESFAIDREVEVAGACRDTILRGGVAVSGDVVMRNLRFAESIDVSGSLALKNAELSGDLYAVRVSPGGSLMAEEVLVSAGSRGIVSQSGTLSLIRARVLDGPGPGVIVSGGTADLKDVFISDRTTPAPTEPGIGVQIGPATELVADRVYLTGTAGEGISVTGAGADAALSSIVIRDPPGLWLAKHGIGVRDGAVATMTKLLITDTGGIGVSVESARAVITGAVFVDTGRSALRVRGQSAELTANEVRATRPHAFGVRAETGTLRLTDVLIEDVQPARISIDGEAQGSGGFGIRADAPERVSLIRVEISRPTALGISIASGGTTDLFGVYVHDVLLPGAGSGNGISLFNTPGTINRTRIEDVPGRGLEMSGTAQHSADTNDLRILNTGGQGLALAFVTVEGSRIEIDGATTEALQMDRAAVTFTDARFANTSGLGIQVGTRDNMDYRESFLRLDRARVENHPGEPCLALGWYGVIEAQDTVVTSCGIGFDIVVIEVGPERVPEGILFLRNGENVRTASGG